MNDPGIQILAKNPVLMRLLCWQFLFLNTLEPTKNMSSSHTLVWQKIKGRSARNVIWKKSPNCYKSCPKRISLEKWKILTPLQKLPKNVGDLG